MTLKLEEFSETRAVRETLIETRYLGDVEGLKGTSGGASYDLKNSQWYYKPEGAEEFYKVNGEDLSCNEEKGWMRCTYAGVNPRIGKEGRAYFSEDDNSWMFKPTGSKELFRVGEGSLTFIRDKDLTTDEN